MDAGDSAVLITHRPPPSRQAPVGHSISTPSPCRAAAGTPGPGCWQTWAAPPRPPPRCRQLGPAEQHAQPLSAAPAPPGQHPASGRTRSRSTQVTLHVDVHARHAPMWNARRRPTWAAAPPCAAHRSAKAWTRARDATSASGLRKSTLVMSSRKSATLWLGGQGWPAAAKCAAAAAAGPA